MKESKIKDGNYLVIQSWMVKELELKGNELLIYACIYGFSQDEEQYFMGSLQYLADWTNTTKRSVMNTLNNLLEKRLIEKQEQFVNGIKYCKYRAKNFHSIEKFSIGGIEKISIGGSEKFSPNNIVLDNIDNIKKESKKAVDYDMLINNYTSNADLKSELTEFIKMRKLIKKPMTNQALTLTFSKLDKYGKTDEEKIMILQNSIMNSWQGVFPLKDEKQTPTYPKKENKKLINTREYTKEQLDSAFSSLDDIW